MISRSLPRDRQTPLEYVALGDSTAFGLGASSQSTHYVARIFRLVQSEYPFTGLTNLGACLATVADVFTYQLPDALAAQPHLVTLSVGPNDLRQGRHPDEFARRVEVVMERLEQETEAAVIVSALPDLALCPRVRNPQRLRLAALTRQYNRALQQVADGFGIKLVDLDISDRAERERRRLFCRDGYHPSDEGYAAWAGAMWPAVWARIPEPVHLLARLA